MQREGVVAPAVAERLGDLSGLLDALAEKKSFDLPVGPAHEVERDIPLDRREKSLRRKPTPIPRPKHARAQAKALFSLRDFH